MVWNLLTFPKVYSGMQKKFFDTSDPPGHRLPVTGSPVTSWGNFAPIQDFGSNFTKFGYIDVILQELTNFYQKIQFTTLWRHYDVIMTSLWRHNDVILTLFGPTDKMLLKSQNRLILGMWPLIFNDFYLESSIFDVLEPLDFIDTSFFKKNRKFCRNVKKLKNMLT